MRSYRNGAEIEYNGESGLIHGARFYRFLWVEGLRAGEYGVTQNLPSSVKLKRLDGLSTYSARTE